MLTKFQFDHEKMNLSVDKSVMVIGINTNIQVSTEIKFLSWYPTNSYKKRWNLKQTRVPVYLITILMSECLNKARWNGLKTFHSPLVSTNISQKVPIKVYKFLLPGPGVWSRTIGLDRA